MPCAVAKFSLAVAIVALVVRSSSGHSIGCYVIGQCKDGTLVGQFKSESATDCLSLCQLSDSCTHFSFQQQERSCNTWSSCPGLDKTCSDCFSGDSDCTASGACYFEGQCQGHFLSVEGGVKNLLECQTHCLRTADCSYHTFDGSTGFCTMFTDCPTVGDCITCVSGHLDCNFEDRPVRFMVVGGIDGSNETQDVSKDVEIIDLYSTETTCIKPADYPILMRKAASAYVNGRPTVCGGLDRESQYLSECHEYDLAGDRWLQSAFNLTAARYNTHSTILPHTNSWLVVGGHPDESMTSSDLLIDGDTFERTPDSPQGFTRHCIVGLNDTHVFVTGSYTVSYILDIENWEWTKMPDMNKGRHWHSCGLVENAATGEDEVMVVGGLFEETSETFNFGTNQWTMTANLPYVVRGAASVQLDKSFLVVGGYERENGLDGESVYLDTIFEYNRFTERFDLKEQRLASKRREHVAIPLPAELEVCT